MYLEAKGQLYHGVLKFLAVEFTWNGIYHGNFRYDGLHFFLSKLLDWDNV